MKKAIWLISSFLTGLILFGCKFPDYTDPYLTNPNFELLLRKEHHCLFSPILSPDGVHLYYIDIPDWDTRIRVPMEEDDGFMCPGDVFVYSLVDKTERLLFSSGVDLDLSRDGTKLLIKVEKGKATYAILMDTSGTVLESIPYGGGVNYNISFNANCNGMFWEVVKWDSIYRAHHTFFYQKHFWADTTTILVYAVPYSGVHFAIFDGDSIYVSRHSPAVNPVETRYVIFRKEKLSRLEDGEWICHDRYRDTIISLNNESRPYYSGLVGWPRWSADGKDLIFSATRGTYRISTVEVWRLKNAIGVVKDAFQKEGRKLEGIRE